MDEHLSSQRSREVEVDVVGEELSPKFVEAPDEDDSEDESEDAAVLEVVAEVV